MIKELTIAIVLGAIIGFGATSGIIALKKQNKTTLSSPTPIVQTNDLTSTPDQQKHTLTITSPDNEIVVDSDRLDIQGQTTPASQIVIHTQTNSFFIEADDSGAFNQTVTLEAGANLIQISSISPTEEQVDFNLIITYSTVDF